MHISLYIYPMKYVYKFTSPTRSSPNWAPHKAQFGEDLHRGQEKKGTSTCVENDHWIWRTWRTSSLQEMHHELLLVGG